MNAELPRRPGDAMLMVAEVMLTIGVICGMAAVVIYCAAAAAMVDSHLKAREEGDFGSVGLGVAVSVVATGIVALCAGIARRSRGERR